MYTYSCRSEFDGFERVFNLEEAAFRRESATRAFSAGMTPAPKKQAYFMPRSVGRLARV